MVWGLLGASLAKTAIRGIAREVASGPRREGSISGPATEPRPVRFVVPIWMGVWGALFVLGAALGVAGQAARLAQGHATGGEAAVASIAAGAICGLPGLGFLAYAAVAGRKKRRLRRAQELAARAGGVAIADLGRELGMTTEAARALADEALRDEHVIGRIDEMGRLVSLV